MKDALLWFWFVVAVFVVCAKLILLAVCEDYPRVIRHGRLEDAMSVFFNIIVAALILFALLSNK